ncbi:unnamed protein product [Coffea canephora]|uniref:DH200=94 genomic scaffold, scaffold_4733 n=1 Tax=Coffea canephora TaxID=49390 RepID=A0A068VLP5_COFCA|nr:unnamed protein product [Coffea canephora]
MVVIFPVTQTFMLNEHKMKPQITIEPNLPAHLSATNNFIVSTLNPRYKHSQFHGNKCNNAQAVVV